MKKLFFITCFTILFVGKIFSQAQIDIPFIVSDGTDNLPLAIGLDLTATNCIDPQLGEWDIPPWPPPGVFDARFNLAPYGCPAITSYKDYRAPGNPPAFPFTGMIEHTLWWQIHTPGLPVNITYNLPPGAIMMITDNITGTLLNLGPFTGQGVATIPGSYTIYAFQAFLKMEYDNIVSVELISFNATLLDNNVRLAWITATETNNSGFEINRKRLEARSKELEWENIGFVPGVGTTTEPKSYSFTDENVTSGTYKYRLKQIEFDGSFEFSNEIEVQVDITPKEFVLYQNYPNPFNPSTVIKFEIPSVIASGAKQSQIVTLKVYDILGNEITTLVNEEKQPGVYEVEFSARGGPESSVKYPASGVYFYQLKGGDFISTKKMVLMK